MLEKVVLMVLRRLLTRELAIRIGAVLLQEATELALETENKLDDTVIDIIRKILDSPSNGKY